MSASKGPGDNKDSRLQADLKEIRRKLGKLRAGKSAASQQASPEHGADDDAPEAPRASRPALHIGDLRRRQPKPEASPKPRLTAPASRQTEGPPVALEQAVDGVEAAAADGSVAYVITERIADREEAWAELCDAFRKHVVGQAASLSAEPLQPEDLIFLDLETTGLESTPLFLIGTMSWEDDGLVVRQFFARHYGEERAAISLFLDSAADKKLLVSFNGKTYDWPYLRMRAMATGVPFDIALPHLDLLHEARRAWKDVLPDCKLQTLESHICGRPVRDGDIPGSEIPDAYHEYVRTGNAAQMLTVLEHNFLDLVTLADLLVRLASPQSHS